MHCLKIPFQLADIRLLHEFAHCPLDTQEFRTAVNYGWTWDTRLTETVHVPGHTGETFLRARDDTLVVLRRMFHCLWLVHRCGLTIRGQFGAHNFVISPHLSVRLRGVHLSTFTHLEGNMDYEAFVISARDIFVLEAIPADLERWLQLIGRGVRLDGGYLLRYYIALMDPRQQLQTLLTSRRMIDRLRRTDHGLYQKIKTRFHRYVDWQWSQRVNDLLQATQSYVNPSNGMPAHHTPDIRGVLKLVRDGWEHPSVDVDEAEYIVVVQDDFPKLLRDVHEALSRAGLLRQLKLEAIMS